MKYWTFAALLMLGLGPMAPTARAQIFGAGPTNGTGLGGYPGPAIPGLYGNYGGTGMYGGYGASGLYGGFGFPTNYYGPYDYYRAYRNRSGTGYGYAGTAFSPYGYPWRNFSAHSSTNSTPHKFKNYFDHSGDNSTVGTRKYPNGHQPSLGRRLPNKAAATP